MRDDLSACSEEHVNNVRDEIFNELFEATKGKVSIIVQSCLARYSKQDWEDTVQDTYELFYDALCACQGVEGMKKIATPAYIHTIAKHTAIDRLRRDGSSDRRGSSSAVRDDGSEADVLALQKDEGAEHAFSEVEDSELLAMTNVLFVTFPREKQKAWRYFFVDKLSRAEIARKLGTTSYLVKKWIEQVRAALEPIARQYLKEMR